MRSLTPWLVEAQRKSRYGATGLASAIKIDPTPYWEDFPQLAELAAGYASKI